MATQATIRLLTVDDRELLRTATLANVNWSGEQRFTHRDVDERPDLRHYTLFRPDRGDLGFVADGVPELSLSVWSGYRGQGVGGELLRLALTEARLWGIQSVSLGVEAGNPSVRLYRSAGFAAVAGAAEGTMAVDL